jgi:hypothetical protein
MEMGPTNRLLSFSGGNGDVPVVLKWNGTAFSALADDPSETGFPVGPLLPMKPSESADLLMGFSLAEALASVSGLVNSTLTVLWKQQGSTPGSVGLKSTDQFYEFSTLTATGKADLGGQTDEPKRPRVRPAASWFLIYGGDRPPDSDCSRTEWT